MPDLISTRRVFLRRGLAYVAKGPDREPGGGALPFTPGQRTGADGTPVGDARGGCGGGPLDAPWLNRSAPGTSNLSLIVTFRPALALAQTSVPSPTPIVSVTLTKTLTPTLTSCPLA